VSTDLVQLNGAVDQFCGQVTIPVKLSERFRVATALRAQPVDVYGHLLG
jgi:hypothetical protein